ncbi:MAG TPA: preprotein translocase subunit SecG [Myxococcota bacterium]|jgi:preprotein translocase subunit SecG
MTYFVTFVHLIVCVILIILVLLQKGKGAEIGAVFGGSSAATLFGSRGAGNFLTKLTTGSAVVFMVTSFYLAYVALNAEAGGRFAVPPASAATPTAAQSAPAPAADFVEVMAEPESAPADAAAPTPEQSSAGAAPSEPAQ